MTDENIEQEQSNTKVLTKQNILYFVSILLLTGLGLALIIIDNYFVWSILIMISSALWSFILLAIIAFALRYFIIRQKKKRVSEEPTEDPIIRTIKKKIHKMSNGWILSSVVCLLHPIAIGVSVLVKNSKFAEGISNFVEAVSYFGLIVSIPVFISFSVFLLLWIFRKRELELYLETGIYTNKYKVE